MLGVDVNGLSLLKCGLCTCSTVNEHSVRLDDFLRGAAAQADVLGKPRIPDGSRENETESGRDRFAFGSTQASRGTGVRWGVLTVWSGQRCVT